MGSMSGNIPVVEVVVDKERTLRGGQIDLVIWKSGNRPVRDCL